MTVETIAFSREMKNVLRQVSAAAREFDYL
jgi:hypothetical protein